MVVQPDFRELLELFNKHGVEYAIVGGYALAFHGAPRYTGDLDILVRPVEDNARRVLAALGEFGFGLVGLTVEDFRSSNRVVQLGVPPVRVDIVTSLTGISTDEAISRRISGDYGDVSVYYLDRGHFVANKRAVGRKKDLADIEALGEE